jgi:hypothetical protein
VRSLRQADVRRLQARQQQRNTATAWLTKGTAICVLTNLQPLRPMTTPEGHYIVTQPCPPTATSAQMPQLERLCRKTSTDAAAFAAAAAATSLPPQLLVVHLLLCRKCFHCTDARSAPSLEIDVLQRTSDLSTSLKHVSRSTSMNSRSSCWSVYLQHAKHQAKHQACGIESGIRCVQD